MKMTLPKSASILTLLFIFASCDNFMDSSLFQSGLETKIDYENSSSHIVFVNSLEGTGSFIQGGGTQNLKKSDSFDVEFSVNSSFKFIKWIAVDRNDTTITRDSYIKFSDSGALKTTVTLLDECDDILIRPYCQSYLTISDFLPEYRETGVGFNSDIKITFSDYIDEASFSFTDDEISALDVDDEDLLKATTFDGKEYCYGYIKNYKTYFKNIDISSSSTSSSIISYFNAPTVINGKTLYLSLREEKYGDMKETISSSSGTNEITVTLSKDITDIRDMSFSESYSSTSYTYAINSDIIADTESVEILFEVDDGYGTISPSGRNTIYTGLTYNLYFKPSSEYYFQKWGILYALNGKEFSYGDQIVQISYPEDTETTFTLTTAVSGIMIKPICAQRSTVLFTYPEGTGIAAKTDIVISFSQEMDSSDLRWSYSDIENYPVKEPLRDNENQIYGYISNSGNHVWKNIEITNKKTGENLLSYFGQAKYADDDKSKLIITASEDLPGNTLVNVRINKTISNSEGIPCGESGEYIEFSYMIE
ncbi:MAG: hypothetical protein IJ630_06190 [Treponema sp.]|nr:hypothetical protein [Treponema sp.]